MWPFASPVVPIAVIAALEIEARTLESLEQLPQPQPRIYVSGPGRERAGAAARAAIAEGAGALVSWGLAGGLGADCACGDVMLPARVLSSEGDWATDAVWRQRIATAVGDRFALSEAPLFSSAQVVTLPQAKAALAARTGAAAIDMESAAVVRAAAEARLPAIVIRVIADGPADELPRRIESLLTSDGRTCYRGLWPLLLAPSQIPLLLTLARRSAEARRVLRRLARSFAERPL